MTKLSTCCRYVFTLLLLSNHFVSANTDVGSTDFDFDDLPSLELDELLATDVQVTSAMKRLQNVSETAASIYVLSSKEIMRSGVTSVAQALKLVPGMQVKKLDNNQWAITSRSVAGRFSSKLLVMIDGQSIYNPGFAGVYWEALDIPLYDIERIEVIRGQGGLLWGSNATNGVVNIISKHTADTQTVLAQFEAGNQIDQKTSFRVGGDLANYSSYRIFGSKQKTDKSSEGSTSIAANDDGEKESVGGRVDLYLEEDLSLLAQTQYTNIEMGQNIKIPSPITYQNEELVDQYKREHFQFMARLEHRLSSVSNQKLQASVSSQRGEQLYYKEQFIITDVDYQMNTLLNDIQFDWGVNYRYNDIDLEDTDYITSVDNITSYDQYGGFVQAQFNIIPDKFKVIIGDRSEKNSFTGWEHQPMARVLWTPHSKHTIWGAISQGVRTPSLIEYNGVSAANGVKVGSVVSTGSDLIDSVRIKGQIVGNSDIEAETSISKELGYRYKDNSWGLDVSLFHTKSKDVIVVEPSLDEETIAQAIYLYSIGNTTDAAALLSTSTFDYNFVSNAELVTYGGEANIKWQPSAKLGLELGYSFSSFDYNLEEGTRESVGYDSYLRQLILKSNYAIANDHSLFAIYRVESGDAYGTDNYSVLDLSWSWKFTPQATFSLTGNNLLYGKHIEYNNTYEVYTIPTYIEPSLLARLTVEF